ncbi:MAG: hypothetical protein Q9164_006939, partial [Protoblastenia rupestris]
LVRHSHVDENEIDAAYALIAGNELSESQKSLFLGILKLRKHVIDEIGHQLLGKILEDVSPPSGDPEYTSVAVLLRMLLGECQVEAEEIAAAVALIFENKLTNAQCALLLGLLAYTGQDRNPFVLAKTAKRMRRAAEEVDRKLLREIVHSKKQATGLYNGGLCDIVGTGGDGHSTFNVSTTASIVASSLLLLSKHGNRASSSTSGSADLLQSVKPKGPIIEAITAQTLPTIYEQSNYAFLFAPIFHPGMKYVAAIRKDLGIRTIFNILGPLANPVEGDIEARIVGVAEQSMGPVFAEALRLSGVKKAIVVCGAENLDEISCAGKTSCWRLYEHGSDVKTQHFELEPADFDLPIHPLSDVAGGKLPQENAKILVDLLDNKLGQNDPVLHFVLINTAALFAIAGICENENGGSNRDAAPGETITERGPGGQRWKEGVRKARWAIESGEASRSLHRYIEATHNCRGQ